MKLINISGDRQTGKTSILIDIAKRSLNKGLTVLFMVRNQHQIVSIKSNFSKTMLNNPNLIFKTQYHKYKGLLCDVLLIDELELEPLWYYSVAPRNGIIYQTRKKENEI